MDNRELCIREIGDIIRRQPDAVRRPLLDICQRLIKYADAEMGFAAALQLREILQMSTEELNRERM